MTTLQDDLPGACRPLPSRPTLRDDIPLLWRRPGRAMLGDHPVAQDLTPADHAWLRGVDGLRTSAALLESHPRAAELLLWAQAAGALEDAAVVPPGVQWAAPADREAARARARAAQDAGIDAGRRDGARIGVVGHGPLAQAIRVLLPAAGLPLAEDVDGAVATLTVLADGAHPRVPRLLEHSAHVLERPHVHAAIRGSRARIGPLVVPGASACLRCSHLHDIDRDAAWPLLAVQWAQQPEPCADALLTQAAAVLTVGLVRQHVDAGPRDVGPRDVGPSDVGPSADVTDVTGIAWDLRLPLLMPLAQSCPPHPLCGCRWDADERETRGAGTMARWPTSPASA